jgi:hypothetical protein
MLTAAIPAIATTPIPNAGLTTPAAFGEPVVLPDAPSPAPPFCTGVVIAVVVEDDIADEEELIWRS